MIQIHKFTIENFRYTILKIPFIVLEFFEALLTLLSFGTVSSLISWNYLMFLAQTKNLTSFKYYKVYFPNFSLLIIILSLFWILLVEDFCYLNNSITFLIWFYLLFINISIFYLNFPKLKKVK